MRILQAVHDSVLWLIEDNLVAAKNLKAETQKRGVSADRIIFAPRMQPADHLARHRAADLFRYACRITHTQRLVMPFGRLAGLNAPWYNLPRKGGCKPAQSSWFAWADYKFSAGV